MSESATKINRVWKVVLFLIVFAFLSVEILAQDVSQPPMRILYPCQAKLQATGAEFSFTYSYWVYADPSGKTKKATPLKSTGREAASRFVNEAAFVECIKKWTLEPNGKYIVMFRVATMSSSDATEPQNYVLILGPGNTGQKLKIELPFASGDPLQNQKGQMLNKATKP